MDRWWRRRVAAAVLGAGAIASSCCLIFEPVARPWLTWAPLQGIAGGVLLLVVALGGPASRALRALLARIPRRDAAFVLGAAAIVTGCWLVFAPLAWAVAGAALIFVAWIYQAPAPGAS
jgi:hypothetical protein